MGICNLCGVANVALDGAGACLDQEGCADRCAVGSTTGDASVAVLATVENDPRARQVANDIAVRYGGGYILEWTDKGLPVRRKRRDANG